MLNVTGGECLEAGVFITVFTRCAMNVPALVCVCVSLISVLSFNMFARLTMNRYLFDPIVMSHCHLCHLSLFIRSLCIPSVFSFLFHTLLCLTGRPSCPPEHRDCSEGADQTMSFLWRLRKPSVLSRDNVKCPGIVIKEVSGCWYSGKESHSLLQRSGEKTISVYCFL